MENIDVCYTVVSLSVVSLDQSKWGIEGDFYAKNEDDAIIQKTKPKSLEQKDNCFTLS